MLLMGIILIFEAVSYYQPNKPFWAFFCLVYLCITFLVTMQTYFLGSLKPRKPSYSMKLMLEEVKKIPEVLKTLTTCTISSVSVRLAFLTFVTAFNVIFFFYMLIYSQEYDPPNSASAHILVMIIGNLLMYMTFYVILKLL